MSPGFGVSDGATITHGAALAVSVGGAGAEAGLAPRAGTLVST